MESYHFLGLWGVHTSESIKQHSCPHTPHQCHYLTHWQKTTRHIWITRHSAWLSFLRERVWSRIKYEEEMIPSDDALLRHWQRSCWVVAVWKQATQNQTIYPPLQGNGWKLDNNCPHIEWDSDDNISKV